VCSIAKFAIDVGDDGDGEHVIGNLVDLVAQKLPGLVSDLARVIIIGLIANVVFIALKSNYVWKIIPITN
jgi:hypothetical protein